MHGTLTLIRWINKVNYTINLVLGGETTTTTTNSHCHAGNMALKNKIIKKKKVNHQNKTWTAEVQRWPLSVTPGEENWA